MVQFSDERLNRLLDLTLRYEWFGGVDRAKGEPNAVVMTVAVGRGSGAEKLLVFFA